MRALAYGVISAVLAALAMWAGGAFLRADFVAVLARSEEIQTRQVAQLAAVTLTQREAFDRSMLELLCRRDINVERLSHELDAGADEAAAARMAALVAESLHEGPAAVLEASAGRAVTLARSSGFPGLTLDGKLLREARTRSVLVLDQGRKPYLARSCEVRDSRRFLLHLLPLEGQLATLRANHLRQDIVWVERATPHAGEAPALTMEGPSGEPYGVMVRAAPPVRSHPDLALAVVVLAALLVAGTAGYFAGRRSDRHERALATIETAARRVAQGDLVSAIGLRIGDRADQTFQTFDRMTKELREMRERLAEAEREAAFREVARRIAHEIKNPLSPIRMAIETLRRARERERADFGEIFEESTRAILEEVKRLERIVREFSEFARLPKPVPGAFDLGGLVRDTVTLYVPDDAELALDIDEGAPLVRADREQITQVLVNLVKNALDAAHASSPARLRIAVTRDARGATLTVEDNGPGIRAEDRERVFEPYYTTKDEGTGLGLSIVKRILSDHRGQIELGESALGGACVRVSLPAYDASAETRAPTASQSTSRP